MGRKSSILFFAILLTGCSRAFPDNKLFDLLSLSSGISSTAPVGPPYSVVLSVTSLTTTEAGPPAQSFTAVLTTAPVGDVIIPISSDDTTEGDVSPDNTTWGPFSLTFTASNWNVPQTVYALGAPDGIVETPYTPYNILLGAITSTDPNYSGRDPTDLLALNTDIDAVANTGVISVISAGSSSTGVITSEAGNTGGFFIVLSRKPTANVSVGPIASLDSTEGVVVGEPLYLTFTPSNWNIAQEIVVRGSYDDLDSTGFTAYSISLGTTSSADTSWNGVTAGPVAAQNDDIFPPITMANGSFHTCALLFNGSVKCWGENWDGQLGQGDQNRRGDNPGEMGSSLPAVSLGTGLTATAISAGRSHTCAILNNGSVKCWGGNLNGQLGLGDTLNRGDNPGEMGISLPAVSLGTGLTATAISAGGNHTCAILSNGSTKCWGYNWNGELGQGDNLYRGDNLGEMGDLLLPINLGLGLSATSISAGGNHTCAILSNGSTKCWGGNWNGELGLGDALSRGANPGEMGNPLPAVSLGTGLTATAISAGGNHTCAILSNGSTKCWGYNWNGQLGQGDNLSRGDNPGEMGDLLLPINLGLGLTATSISAGGNHTCAILSNGSTKCWGYNWNGQLGLGDTLNRGDNPGEMGNPLPAVNLGTGLNAVTVRAGGNHTCAITNVFNVKCWGYNWNGELGQGDTASRGDALGEMGDVLPPTLLGN